MASASNPPRVWVSKDRPAAGEVVRVRAQIEHRMESGFRHDEAGKPLPRNILTRFEARLGDTLLLTWEPGVTVAQNPYIEFTFKARASGTLQLRWSDDTGRVAEASRQITLA